MPAIVGPYFLERKEVRSLMICTIYIFVCVYVCVCVCACVGVCNNMQVQIHECFCVFVVCLAHHSVLLLDLQEEVGLEGQGVLEARPVLL